MILGNTKTTPRIENHRDNKENEPNFKSHELPGYDRRMKNALSINIMVIIL